MGERGLNLAAVALLGKGDTILDVVPLYRTDAVLRRVETDCYDDRLICRRNLVRAYDELVGFCEKWLPDSFVLDGGQRKSSRDVIVRELLRNCLIHRELVSPHIARITIDGEGIRTSNASRALSAGSPVMAGMAESECGHDAATGAEGGRAVGGSRSSRTRAEVERVVDDLIARYSSFSASAVGERVASVGERTVRRYLAAMVKEGKLVSAPRGRSTIYRAGNPDDRLSGDC